MATKVDSRNIKTIINSGIKTIKDTLDNLGLNAVLAKIYNIEMIILIIITLIIFLIIFWFYNTSRLLNSNCLNLANIYGSIPASSINSINLSNPVFGGKLIDYYIKTAYNCCCAGNFKNDFVDSESTSPKLCALTNCIQQGARCLDFEIYSYRDMPVIAASSLNSNNIKETFNYLDFDDAMNWLANSAFTPSFCSNSADPLILNFRIMSSNTSIYPIMAASILKWFPDENRLESQYSINNYCKNLAHLPLLTFQKKLIIIIDNNTFNNLIGLCPTNCSNGSSTLGSPQNNCQNPNLLEVVHIHSESPYLKTIRFTDLQITGDIASMQLNNKTSVTMLLPDLNANSKNMDPTIGMNYGCQFVGMSFQTFDVNMEYYTLFFNNAATAFVLKPENLRYIPQYVAPPPPLPDAVTTAVAPQNHVVSSALGTSTTILFPKVVS